MRNKCCLLMVIMLALVVSLAHSSLAADITEQELRSRIEEATKNFSDLSMTGKVTYKDKDALAKVDESFARLYEFQTASVYLKYPDKLRMEGKLGMVKFEYLINGTTKIFRAPTIRINRKQDYAHDPAKLQEALDVGIITPQLWKYRKVEVIDDSEAEANGEIKLRLRWPKGNMRYFIWIDAEHYWLKKYEKLNEQDVLEARVIYTDPMHAGGVIWMPTKVEMYAPDGTRAAATEFFDIKVNTGLSDKLFE